MQIRRSSPDTLETRKFILNTGDALVSCFLKAFFKASIWGSRRILRCIAIETKQRIEGDRDKALEDGSLNNNSQYCDGGRSSPSADR